MEKQRTIAKEVEIEGIGLHTGNMTKAVFKPAPANSGVRFIRTDLPNNPVIPAKYTNVLGAIRGTTIGNGEARAHTVEHMLAVFSALGVDNIDVYMSNNEPPVVDGSARPFADMILKAGTVEQDAPREFFVLKEPFIYEADGVRIEAIPYDGFKIDCHVQYNHPFLSQQDASVIVTQESFINEISSARTFCFDYEIEALKQRGLAKGGNLSNAIVIGLNEIHNPDKILRFKDEFVRHKILDLIGDLYLLGHPIKAHIKASRPGHNHNINFVKKLIEMGSKQNVAKTEEKKEKTMEVPQEVKQEGEDILIDINGIKKAIPHRYPFLLIDKVKIHPDGKTATGYKCVSANEEFFNGHFPNNPIMPGVLIVEAMAQTTCVMLLSRHELQGKTAYFMSIDNVKFRRPVVPGDVLELRVEILRAKERGGKAKSEGYVEGKLTTEAEFTFVVINKEG